MQNDPSFYRAQAERCRRLAKAIVNAVTENELLRLAREMDEKAAEIEAAMLGQSDIESTC